MGRESRELCWTLSPIFNVFSPFNAQSLSVDHASLSQMSFTEETLAAMRREMRPLLETAMEGVLTELRGVLEEAEQQRTKGLANVAEERAKGLVEVAEERSKGLADIDARRAELHREVATMHKHKEARKAASSSTSAATTSRRQCRRCGASRTPSSTRTSAAGTRRTCVMTAASS
jgi:hypothetical protein